MNNEKEEKIQLSQADLRKKLIKHFFLIVVALTILCFLVAAWFVSNKRVSGTGISISAAAPRFELATKSATHSIGIYDTLFSADVAGADITRNGIAFKSTGSDFNAISWWVGTDSSMNNYGDDASGIQPFANGSLSFSILPLVNDLDTDHIKFSVKAVLYGDAISADEGAIQIGDDYYKPIETDARVSELFKGHFHFFKDKSDANGYSEHIDYDQEFELIRDSSSVTNSHIDYTIYWVWPGLFRQFIYFDNDSLFKNTNTSTIRDSFINQINTPSYQKYFFADRDGAVVSSGIPGHISSDMSTEDLQICTDLYNNGDELIGSTVRYIRLELYADE